MNTIKTVFLAALLSAAAYGVYVGVTGAPPNFGVRRKAKEWQENLTPDADSEIGLDVVPSAPQVHETPLGSGGFAAAPAGSAPLPPGPDPGGANHGLPAVGEAPPDRYASNQSYPSMRSAPPHDTAPPTTADALPPAESYPPDRYAAERYGERYPADDHRSPGEAAAGLPGEPLDHDMHAEYVAMLQSMQALLVNNRLAEVQLELSQWYGNPSLSAEEDAQLTDLLDRLAGTVIYSRQHLLERAYEVQPGDTLEKIADAFEVPWQLLANINGIPDPRRVRPGDQLKVVRGPFGAFVDVSRFRLVLYVGNRYAGQFPIGVGEDHSTPEGEFEVQKKVVNPTYYGPTVIDKDDPNNPLGEYALHLGGDLWIHGTNDPSSIGKPGSRGCIRLGDRDIKDVFEILTARTDRTGGSKVVIKHTALR